MAKKIIISVISDLATDQRVQRTALTIHDMGYDVTLVGRLLPSSLGLQPLPYRAKRLKLWFHKGPLFYLEYNIRLFFYLMKSKPDMLFSNDLDTLPANFMISRLKKLPLFYDSHEYFTGVPELTNRPLKRKIWKWLEGRMLPKVTRMFTVNESIANLYQQEYGVNALVMRNTPELQDGFLQDKLALRKELGLPLEKPIYVLQGSGINIQRGAEEMVEAMQYSGGLLLIIGGGDVMMDLQKMVKQYHLEDKVLFIPKMPFQELRRYTMASDVGLTLDKDLSINYRFSLPNKLFDYIHAGLPVLASDLPEVRKIIERYHIGMITLSHDPKVLAALLQKMTENAIQMQEWKSNSLKAAKELNWQKEKQILIQVFDKF